MKNYFLRGKMGFTSFFYFQCAEFLRCTGVDDRVSGFVHKCVAILRTAENRSITNVYMKKKNIHHSVIIYQAKNGALEFKTDVKKETIWITNLKSLGF